MSDEATERCAHLASVGCEGEKAVVVAAVRIAEGLALLACNSHDVAARRLADAKAILDTYGDGVIPPAPVPQPTATTFAIRFGGPIAREDARKVSQAVAAVCKGVEKSHGA